MVTSSSLSGSSGPVRMTRRYAVPGEVSRMVAVMVNWGVSSPRLRWASMAPSLLAARLALRAARHEPAAAMADMAAVGQSATAGTGYGAAGLGGRVTLGRGGGSLLVAVRASAGWLQLAQPVG